MEENATIATKRCSRCKRELPTTDFHRNNHTKDGCQSECKECRKEIDKERRLKAKNNSLSKVYSNQELAKFTPRQLMEELKARGFTWDYMLEPQKKIHFNKI